MTLDARAEIMSGLGLTEDKVKKVKPEQGEPHTPVGAKPADQKPAEVKPSETKPVVPGDSLGLDLSGVLDEPKPKEAKPEPDVEPVHDESSKDGKAFAAMRRQIKELNEKLALIQSQPVEAPKELQALQEQLKAKDVELQKAYDQIGALDLERDPRFVGKYQQIEGTIESQIIETAKELGVDEDVVKAAMSYPLKKRIEYLQEEAGAAAPMLLTLFSQRDAVAKQKVSELSKHKEVRQQLDQQRGVQDLAMEQQARARLFQSALVAAKETGHFVFQEAPDNEARSALAQKATKMAEELFTSNDGERQAKAMMLGVAAPVYLHMLHIERTKRLAAEQELKERYGKRGAINGNSGATSGGGGGKPTGSMSADDAATALAKKFGM